MLDSLFFGHPNNAIPWCIILSDIFSAISYFLFLFRLLSEQLLRLVMIRLSVCGFVARFTSDPLPLWIRSRQRFGCPERVSGSVYVYLDKYLFVSPYTGLVVPLFRSVFVISPHSACCLLVIVQFASGIWYRAKPWLLFKNVLFFCARVSSISKYDSRRRCGILYWNLLILSTALSVRQFGSEWCFGFATFLCVGLSGAFCPALLGSMA